MSSPAKKKLKIRMTTKATLDFGIMVPDPDSVSNIMSFLDVPSLVRFGSASKCHHDLFQKEVLRRRARFGDIAKEIKALLATEFDSGHVQQGNLVQAEKLKAEAIALIDSGLNWIPNHLLKWVSVSRLIEPKMHCTCSKDRLFLEERKQLKLHDLYTDLNRQLMLPSIFYHGVFSTHGLEAPDAASLSKMNQLLISMCYAEDMMESVHAMTKFTPIQDPNHPLRQFNNPLAEDFCEFTYDLVSHLAVDVKAAEAFRIATRKFVKERPSSMPCLYFALKTIEDIAAEE
jgi:hypothetical protein